MIELSTSRGKAFLLPVLLSALSLGLNACSVLPEPSPGNLHTINKKDAVPLGEVVVIGRRERGTGKMELPCGGNCDGTGGSGGSGGGAGGGSSSGGGSGGQGGTGSSPSTSYDTTVGTADGTGEIVRADVGDRALSMAYKFDDGTNIIVKIEYTQSGNKVEKISTTTTGLVYGTVFKPFGDGIATYNAATNSFDFIVEFQFEGGTSQTGPIMSGPIYQLVGSYGVATNRYNMRMIKKK